MREVAASIGQVLRDTGTEEALAAVRARVKVLTDAYPLYRWKTSPTGAFV
jgi:hypothetical protein